MAISFLASCSDEEIVADVKFPQEMEQAQTEGLESYSYSIPFEVKSDTEWKIEFDEIGEELRSWIDGKENKKLDKWFKKYGEEFI